MKTATIRELRNDYSRLLRWVAAGEEVEITKRGEPVARLVPRKVANEVKVDWTQSPIFKQGRRKGKKMSAETSAQMIAESRGRW